MTCAVYLICPAGINWKAFVDPKTNVPILFYIDAIRDLNKFISALSNIIKKDNFYT